MLTGPACFEVSSDYKSCYCDLPRHFTILNPFVLILNPFDFLSMVKEPKERARIKKLLNREEALYPNFYDNIRRSLLPLMHDDLTAILHSYTEEVVSKSRKVPYAGKRKQQQQGMMIEQNGSRNNGEQDGIGNSSVKEEPLAMPNKALASASEEELLLALTKKRAERFRLAGAMGRQEDPEDPTGMVCTLNGGNGTIPCRELME